MFQPSFNYHVFPMFQISFNSHEFLMYYLSPLLLFLQFHTWIGSLGAPPVLAEYKAPNNQTSWSLFDKFYLQNYIFCENTGGKKVSTFFLPPPFRKLDLCQKWCIQDSRQQVTGQFVSGTSISDTFISGGSSRRLFIFQMIHLPDSSSHGHFISGTFIFFTDSSHGVFISEHGLFISRGAIKKW